jgi:hypothetical protein
MLRAAYPEFEWDPARFRGFAAATRTSVPRSFWTRRDNLLAALRKAEQAMGITNVCFSFKLSLLLILICVGLCGKTISSMIGSQ